MGVQASMALYWWQRLITLNSSLCVSQEVSIQIQTVKELVYMYAGGIHGVDISKGLLFQQVTL